LKTKPNKKMSKLKTLPKKGQVALAEYVINGKVRKQLGSLNLELSQRQRRKVSFVKIQKERQQKDFTLSELQTV